MRPIALDAHRARIDHERVPGRELRNAAERCLSAGEEPEVQEHLDRLVVQFGPDKTAGEQALQFGGEDEDVADAAVVERLDPEPVAREHEPALLPVPDRCAEHAAQVGGEVGAVPLVEMREDLRVATAAERVAVSAESVAKFAVVVQLPVLDRLDGPAFVRERLVASLDVDDAEPPDAECDSGLLENAAVVRATVRHGIGHVVEHARPEDPARIAPDLNGTADSAHWFDATGGAPGQRPPRA